MFSAIFVLTLLIAILMCSRTASLRQEPSAGSQHDMTGGQNQPQPPSATDTVGFQARLPSCAPRRNARRRSRCRCCGRSRKKSGACRRCNSRRR